MSTWKLAVPLSLVAAAAVATCAYNPPPIRVEGTAETLGFLAGEWGGSYRGVDSDRTGSIFFRLSAGADTAYGDVLMTRFRDVHAPGELERPEAIEAPPILSVQFVVAQADRVRGMLDEYNDPDCGCRLQTTFTGRIRAGDRIEGTFSTLHIDTGVRHEGTWSVRRTGPPPAREADLPEPGEPGAEPLVGPSEDEMVAEGRVLFEELGCSFCHDGAERIGPDLGEATEHRSFSWIYRMILNPDSMVRHDPVAAELYRDREVAMPDRGANPWEALLLYEYLIARTREEDPGR